MHRCTRGSLWKRSETRRRTSANDDAGFASGIMKAVWQSAVEEIAVPCRQRFGIAVYRDINLALHHDTRFFTFVAEQFRAGIRAGRVGLMKDLQCVRLYIAQLAQCYLLISTGGNDGQFVRSVKHPFEGAASSRFEKNSAMLIGMASKRLFSEATDGLVLFFSISEMVPLVRPARAANSRCDSPRCFRIARSLVPISKLYSPPSMKTRSIQRASCCHRQISAIMIIRD